MLISTFDTANISAMWEGNMATSVSGAGTLGQCLTNEGLFSFDPNALRGLIVDSASGVSTTNTTGLLHQKLDKTEFSYINRSYGLGSAAGVIDIPGTKDPQWCSYIEPGFVSAYSCINNASSAYVLEELPVPQGWELAVYQAEGEYPNAVETGGWIYAAYAPADIFSWEQPVPTKAEVPTCRWQRQQISQMTHGLLPISTMSSAKSISGQRTSISWLTIRANQYLSRQHLRYRGPPSVTP